MEVAQQQSTRLAALLKARAKGGFLCFAEVMQALLYEPGLGYYVSGHHKIGAGGDFITAPECSPFFSQCLANQVKEIFNVLPQKNILEFGAGTGRMMVDGLLHLASINALPEHYYILEVSPELCDRQRRLLLKEAPQFTDRVTWLSALPENFVGVVLANEVFDAMPVHLFSISNDEVFEKGIDAQLQWQQRPAASFLKGAVESLQQDLGKENFCEGYTSEINLALPYWFESLNAAMKQGVIISIDYGFPEHEYYHPDRSMGTLMCHYQHRAHADPLVHLGAQDITAHVDFTAVTRAACEQGFDLLGYTNQAAFLLGNGLLACEQGASSTEQFKSQQAIKQLTLPHEMGELFKVIAFGKNVDLPLTGFSMVDLSARL